MLTIDRILRKSKSVRGNRPFIFFLLKKSYIIHIGRLNTPTTATKFVASNRIGKILTTTDETVTFDLQKELYFL